jgi:hypothetical protein
MHFSLRYLDIVPGKVPACLPTIGEHVERLGLSGRLLACLYSEIGTLNRVLLLHASDDAGALVDDEARIASHADAFGVADITQQQTFEILAGFPSHTPPGPGAHGPIYEVRTYRIKPNGVGATHAAWDKVLEKRKAVSPLLAVMHSVTGPTRFVHIWPYADIAERMAKRAQAVEVGAWPPPGGILQITAMHSDIYLPAPFSPSR